jgi:hypothetical protein
MEDITVLICNNNIRFCHTALFSSYLITKFVTNFLLSHLHSLLMAPYYTGDDCYEPKHVAVKHY